MTAFFLPTGVAALSAALLVAAPAAAQPATIDEPVETSQPFADTLPQIAPDPRLDSSDGRQLATWAPAVHFDHQRMLLELTIPDMNEAKLDARMVLTLAPVGQARPSLILDCKGPEIASVKLDGRPCTFQQTGGFLRIEFPEPLALNKSADVEIVYSLNFKRNRGEGLTWSAPREEAESITLAFPQIHSQGQADENSRWFPCHDFPNERLATELIVDVESGYKVCSNGELVRQTKSGARTVWHWVQDKPHPNYLVTLVVGKFSIVELGGPDSARPNLPMPLYVQQGAEDEASEVFANTAEMVAVFEKLFDEPYPWTKYAQLCVRDFVAGGMENTSATSLYSGAARGEKGDQDDLIAHELAHQWFGDLLTCRSWDHLWLNEGWASYAECLWAEHVGSKTSPEAATRAYQRAVIQNFRKQRGMNRAAAPQVPALVTNRYTDPDKLFSRVDDVYSKGAIILHMLRERLGDDAFFAGVRKYIDDHKAVGLVETADFRRALEATSGQSLERFFEQWALRPGMASLDVGYSHDDDEQTLSITVEQTQTIDRLNPAYAFTLPFRLRFADGTIQWAYLDTDSQSASVTVKVPSLPEQISIDPNLTVFARSSVSQPLASTIRQLLDPPTEFARAAALDALIHHIQRAFNDASTPAYGAAQ